RSAGPTSGSVRVRSGCPWATWWFDVSFRPGVSGLEGVLGRRERARRDLRGVGARGIPEVGAQVGVLLHEPRRAPTAQPGHVLPDEHLGVAVRAGADADRRDAQRFG